MTKCLYATRAPQEETHRFWLHDPRGTLLNSIMQFVHHVTLPHEEWGNK
jgi:hypothetical protein